ncbi:MAG: 4Fe-4S binding protein [Syntrophorhabdaceae bacterium]|nr:4Fe-4S binding protein [Syntrophorhabdaceae bacterium]
MGKKRIHREDERCSGCLSCAIACSVFNFDEANPSKSYIKLKIDERKERFHISIDEERCKLCGECIKACYYNALRWEDEAPRS